MSYGIKTNTFAPDGQDGRPLSASGHKAIFSLFIDQGKAYTAMTASTMDEFLELKEAFTTALANVNKAIELELED